MNPPLVGFAIVLAVGVGHMALAQEVARPEAPLVKDGKGSAGDECLSLRMPGIAEPPDEYDAYVQQRCWSGSIGMVEASVVIGRAGERYRGFLKGCYR